MPISSENNITLELFASLILSQPLKYGAGIESDVGQGLQCHLLLYTVVARQADTTVTK